MTDKIQTTDSYKGVRDFYPDDMAIQRYIFDVWSQTAESFGFERYDASVLEPSDLYKAKGAENEEMVNEQTYTFIDRGEREVTLRPEMTPTVARMVAGRRRELSFPIRWYSIPNLFRYERPQRGRLREHWQLNCDIFGADHFTADVELIALANQMLLNFGADSKMFEIRVNDKSVYASVLKNLAVELGAEISDQQIIAVSRATDRINKIPVADYRNSLLKIFLDDTMMVEKINDYFRSTAMKNNGYYEWRYGEGDKIEKLINGLAELNILNVKYDKTLMRGFDYYTGTIFEIFDISGENNRAMLGGGRYDNLTEMFGGEAISGIGFGMGDVTMRDFLETHNLLTANTTAPDLMVIPMDPAQNLTAQKIAMQFREVGGLNVATDISSKKLGKKIGDASEKLVSYVMVVGENEIKENLYTLKNLNEEMTTTGTINEILKQFTDGTL